MFLHLLGLAALLGSQVVQLNEKDKYVDRSILYGAFLVLVSNIGLLYIDARIFDWLIGGVQIGIAVLIATVVIWLYNKPIPRTIFTTIFVLTLAELFLLVFWLI